MSAAEPSACADAAVVTSSDGSAMSDDEDDVETSIATARATVASNPSSYEAHQNLISALRRGELDELRSARRNFANMFPLAPPIWSEWLADEMRIAGSREDREVIARELIPRALSDYMSVDLTCACIQIFADRVRHEDCTLQDLSEWFNESCVLSSHVYTEGFKVWEAYLSELKALNAPEGIVLSVVERQKSVPLRRGISEESIDLENAHLFDIFEDKLVSSGSNPGKWSGSGGDVLVAQYAAYVAGEPSGSEIVKFCIWERCISECFLSPQAWLLYAEFCKDHFAAEGLKVTRIGVLRRAVRNVPWSLPVWVALLSAAFSEGNETEIALSVQDVLSTATPHVLQSDDFFSAESLACLLVHAWYRRGQDKTIDRNDERLPAQLETAVSYNVEGSSSWAAVNLMIASYDDNGNFSKSLIERVLLARGTEAGWWIQSANILENAASYADARNLFARGLQSIEGKTEVESLRRAWLLYECRILRHNCSQLVETQGIVDARLRELHTSFRGSEISKRVTTARRKRGPQPLTRPRRKRPVGDLDLTTQSVATRNSPMSKGPNVDALGPSAHSAPDSRSHLTQKEKESASDAIKNGNADAPAPRNERAKEETTYEEKVVYLNNLDFTVTEDDIARAFDTAGTVQEVRIPKRKDGAAKGFAYVEFESDEAVQAALLLNNMKIAGREVRIRRSKPPRAKSKAKGEQVSKSLDKPPTSFLSRPRARISSRVTSVQSGKEDTEMRDSDGKETSTESRSLCQGDFRAMFIQKP